MENSTIFLVAMRYERENIFKNYSLVKLDNSDPFKAFKFDGGIVVETVIGKSNTAAATQFVLDKYLPKRIINIGLCGSLTEEHKKGDVVKVGKCAFHDVDVRAFDYKLGQIPGCESDRYVLDPNEDTLCLTGDQFVDDSKKVDALVKDFPGSKLIEMELASIAHVLHIHGKLNILESYKIISDGAAEDASKEFYDAEEVMFNKIRVALPSIITNNP